MKSAIMISGLMLLGSIAPTNGSAVKTYDAYGKAHYYNYDACSCSLTAACCVAAGIGLVALAICDEYPRYQQVYPDQDRLYDNVTDCMRKKAAYGNYFDLERCVDGCMKIEKRAPKRVTYVRSR